MTREELNEDKQEEIFKEEKKKKRKKRVINFFKFLLIFLILFYGFYLYTTYISTGSIIVKEKRIINNNIPNSFNGLKIIQFSDLHYGSNIDSAKLEEIINLINERNPDLVFFTGDLISKEYKLNNKEQEDIIEKLKSINASLGKYAVYGNEDSDKYSTIMNQSNFTILNNEYDLIYNNSNETILLSGFGSLLNNNLDVDKGLSYYNEATSNTNIYSIALFHEPDSVDKILSKRNVNLLLAGHSHNGTIRLPYFGGIIKKAGAKKYNDSFYKLGDSEFYISSGLGTEGDGIRLFCKPSINFFRISNS